ncbi:phage portal protein, SPP1 family [Lactococcus chungangensis CAU 28 = DSM 22330]|uniref:Phage portal protein, SPP1 family n=1 Tax=Pseudolactococcus chungangensis CAU 28 = DSM 22330 TaxID=1122154 RepID=A0A1K2H7L0_9LACT|nr:phage portal protein [Lactococcus chungangensis]SFZ71748.1 phage portal protein, SPP1 family [Lactococcus chungangensis CAU 28 = DSM 22330]
MDIKYLKSDNPSILSRFIDDAVKTDRQSPIKEKMSEGLRYYDYKHDILKFRLFYYNEDGKLVEETNRSNIKIPHAFFTEQVDQKVQYLLSNPVEFETADTELKTYLEEYIDDDFQLMLQEMVEGASKKAYEFAYVYRATSGKLLFKVADSRKVVVIYDDMNEVIAIIRYYDTDITKDNRKVTVTKAELWDTEKTWFFVSSSDYNNRFILDESQEINPRFHQVVEDSDGNLLGKGFGYIPFLKLSNNKNEKTDLEPIKALIDDYDLMACALSNNLVDFDHPIYAVKGYQSDNLDNLVTNLRTKKTVGVSQDGGIDVKTVDIPVTARKTKLETDKEAIYKFGMAFDSSQVGDGNITNIVIKSRYSLLDLKCNKTEIRLRAFIKQLLDIIIQDINDRYHKSFKRQQVVVVITRSTLINQTDSADTEKVEAETKGQLIQNLLDVAPYLDDESLLKKICAVQELDYDEVVQRLGSQDFSPSKKDVIDSE